MNRMIVFFFLFSLQKNEYSLKTNVEKTSLKVKYKVRLSLEFNPKNRIGLTKLLLWPYTEAMCVCYCCCFFALKIFASVFFFSFQDYTLFFSLSFELTDEKEFFKENENKR